MTAWPGALDRVVHETIGAMRVVTFALGDVDHVLEELPRRAPKLPSPPERAVAQRRAEFLAGRYAAGLALEALGCASAWSVGRGEDGAPHWPAGFIGSITHGAGVIAAATARSEALAGIGIDVERRIAMETEHELSERITHTGEIERVRRALPEAMAPAAFTLVFSAKESLFKCLYPLVGEFFDFHDATVIEVHAKTESSGELRIRLDRTLHPRFLAGWEASGMFALRQDRIQTVVTTGG
jgi:enterobactin synthetase component D